MMIAEPAQCVRLAPFEVALFWLPTVLVLNEMVLVLVLDAVFSSTSTANAEYEYEYEKPRDNGDCGPQILEQRNIKTSASGSREPTIVYTLLGVPKFLFSATVRRSP